MRFTKMNGIGNDFIVLNGEELRPDDPAALARRLCRRGHSVGADGLMLVHKGSVGDARMELYNADGSVADMCGNGIRCCAKFAYDSGISRKERLVVETPAGLKEIGLMIENGEVTGATVDMGVPKLRPEEIPVSSADNCVSVRLDGKDARFFCVNTGVPHAVTFDVLPDAADMDRLGYAVEHDAQFPERTNACFARVIDRTHIEARVWERGCGATLACGTGASAVLTAAHQQGLAEKSAEIRLPGGSLRIELRDDGHVFMTGPAEMSFTGDV